MNNQSGFTIVELIMVIVLLGIVSVVAVMKGTSPGLITLPSQAQNMASDIRHAQTLAYTRGQRMYLAIHAGTNGSYNVCVAGASCSSITAIFNGNVTRNVVLAGSDLYFNSLGQPSDSSGVALASDTSYTLCYPSCGSGNALETITVARLTGYVAVTP